MALQVVQLCMSCLISTWSYRWVHLCLCLVCYLHGFAGGWSCVYVLFAIYMTLQVRAAVCNCFLSTWPCRLEQLCFMSCLLSTWPCRWVELCVCLVCYLHCLAGVCRPVFVLFAIYMALQVGTAVCMSCLLTFSATDTVCLQDG